MCTKTKIWKPGQIVTIGSKKYRVVKSQSGCIDCANVNTMSYDIPCIVCIPHKFRSFCLGVQYGIVLKELKPNQNKM